MKEKSDNTTSFAAGDLDSVAVLAGKLAHEIKNPLNVIYMNLQLLQEEWQGASSAKERRLLQKLSMLKQEAQRLRDILDDFLRYARLASLRLEECDLNAVVEEVVDFVRPDAMSRDIRILMSCSSEPFRAGIERNLFKQALLNILLNAQQAIEDKEAPDVSRRERDILVKTALREDKAVIDISDTGVGIAPEALSRIFDAFYSTKASGTGLGLSTTKRIIEAHGGLIEVFSTPGKGSNFRITLGPVRERGET